MIGHFFLLLFWLAVAHGMSEYVLQSEQMRREKIRHRGGLWVAWLTAHAMCCGLAVSYVVYRYLFFRHMDVMAELPSEAFSLAVVATLYGIIETALHLLIDLGRCEGWCSDSHEVAMHATCLICYAAALTAL